MIGLSSKASMPKEDQRAASSSLHREEKPQEGEVVAVGPGGRAEKGETRSDPT
jgi:co-chaperonin GroES (HSP10)